MGLDVYVGSLTRYYSGDWETIIQSLAHETGVPVVVESVETRPNAWGALGRLLQLFRVPGAFRSSSRADRVTDPATLRAEIIAWRAALTNTLGNDLDDALDWDESDESLYFTDKPTWDGYAALVLLAAHVEHPEFAWPEEVPRHLDQDPAWAASTAEGSQTRYRQILTPELWLPCAFEIVFLAPDPGGDGEEVFIGSSRTLLDQLRELNEQTFRGSPDDLARWSYDGVEAGSSFSETARFGLALFLDLAEKSVSHRLPMKLDY